MTDELSETMSEFISVAKVLYEYESKMREAKHEFFNVYHWHLDIRNYTVFFTFEKFNELVITGIFEFRTYDSRLIHPKSEDAIPVLKQLIWELQERIRLTDFSTNHFDDCYAFRDKIAHSSLVDVLSVPHLVDVGDYRLINNRAFSMNVVGVVFRNDVVFYTSSYYQEYDYNSSLTLCFADREPVGNKMFDEHLTNILMVAL